MHVFLIQNRLDLHIDFYFDFLDQTYWYLENYSRTRFYTSMDMTQVLKSDTISAYVRVVQMYKIYNLAVNVSI